MPDTRVKLGGLELKNPVICASGEHVLTEAGIRAGLEAGAAVVVAKSVNETAAAREQLARTDYALFDTHWAREPWRTGQWRESNLLCRSGLQPMATDDWIERIARLDAEARQRDAWVAGSLILADLGEAVSIARSMEQAGLRLIEFNVGAPYGDEAASGQSLPSAPPTGFANRLRLSARRSVFRSGSSSPARAKTWRAWPPLRATPERPRS